MVWWWWFFVDIDEGGGEGGGGVLVLVGGFLYIQRERDRENQKEKRGLLLGRIIVRFLACSFSFFRLFSTMISRVSFFLVSLRR